MKTLTIEHRALFGLRRRRRDITIPENYGELSPSQFQAVVIYTKGWMDELTFFSIFFSLPLSVVKSLDTFITYKLNNLLSFLSTPTTVNRLLIPSITATTGGKTLRLMPPGPKLSGMTFQQFITADTFFAWYNYTDKEQYLYNFITTLYTDPDIPFAELQTDTMRQAILGNPANTRELMEAVVVNWMFIRKWLAEAYPAIFPSAPPPPEQPGQTRKKTPPSSWLPLFDALVDEDLTRINSYQTLPAIDVIRIINRKIQNQKKHK